MFRALVALILVAGTASACDTVQYLPVSASPCDSGACYAPAPAAVTYLPAPTVTYTVAAPVQAPVQYAPVQDTVTYLPVGAVSAPVDTYCGIRRRGAFVPAGTVFVPRGGFVPRSAFPPRGAFGVPVVPVGPTGGFQQSFRKGLFGTRIDTRTF